MDKKIEDLKNISKKPIFVNEYNEYVKKNIFLVKEKDIDNAEILLDENWEELYDMAYEKDDFELKKKLRRFKKVQNNSDCIPLRIWKEFLKDCGTYYTFKE